MNPPELIPHLFRTEFRKITAVLCKAFGIAHIAIAEDIASETFLSALETWSYSRTPDNPTAWLYAVAKNKARNALTRQRRFQENVLPQFENLRFAEAGLDLSDENISDSQLSMLFVVCHPSIPAEAQVGLALRTLCGFGIDEIANALLCSKEAVNKKLFRAREKLRFENVVIGLPPPGEIADRLGTVLTTLYLLFNEGYYSETRDEQLREDICLEAMRLTHMLVENKTTNLPPVNALLALMCFHASRFRARKDENGEMLLYAEQNELKWDRELISQGSYFLAQAAHGDKISRYHLEASIAWWHTIRTDTTEKWETILQLFNQLLQIEYSPIAALNRTYALSRARGKQTAIEEALNLQLTQNHFYYVLLGELYTGSNNQKAEGNYKIALSMAKTPTDRKTIQQKIERLTVY